MYNHTTAVVRKLFVTQSTETSKLFIIFQTTSSKIFLSLGLVRQKKNEKEDFSIQKVCALRFLEFGKMNYKYNFNKTSWKTVDIQHKRKSQNLLDTIDMAALKKKQGLLYEIDVKKLADIPNKYLISQNNTSGSINAW